MKATLKKLLNTYGPSGHEGKISEVIRAMIADFVDSIQEDAMGNLIAVKKGNGKRIMLSAHMDQIGFVVTDVDEKGFLRVHNIGGIHRADTLNRHVVFENGVHGIVSYEIEDFKPAENSMRPLFIDIGAADRADALSRIAIGDVAVYAPDAYELGNDLMASPAMDNRVGCAVLIEALKLLEHCPNEVYAVFSVQEELGLRGARAAAYGIEPYIGIALDVTLSGDTPKGNRIAVGVGKGPCVKIMDSSVICSPKVVNFLEDAAERKAIPVQREVLTAGGTDAGVMQHTREGVYAGAISVACRYVHSACEVVSVSDCEQGAQLLAEAVCGKIEF